MITAALKKKVIKFAEMAQELRQGQSFNITRLTSLKSLCQNPSDANAFCQHLAHLTQQTMTEKSCPDHLAPETWQLYQQTVNAAMTALNKHLAASSPDPKETQLIYHYSQLKNLQNQYHNQSWGGVRIINSMDMLLVEHVIDCVLHPQQCSDWGYRIARTYAERYDSRYGTGLIPESAPRVEEIADFWFRYHLGYPLSDWLSQQNQP
jgi:hypothetical protein